MWLKQNLRIQKAEMAHMISRFLHIENWMTHQTSQDTNINNKAIKETELQRAFVCFAGIGDFIGAKTCKPPPIFEKNIWISENCH